MNIKSILRSIRFLALLIGNMMMAGCSNSDKPAYLEPHLITTEATHITRTEATLNGSATIEGETEMPKLLFRYGTSESMNLNTSEVHAQGADVSLVLTGLKAGTTYYYMLQGNNGRTTTTSNMMSFTTQPNISPKLSSATLLSHGPMSAFVSYEITDDGGEPMTETGCYVYLTGEPENKQKCIVENFDGKKGKIKLRIGNLERNAHYEFQPFARNRVGETIGTAIKYDTSDAITLNETGELIQLMGNHLYEYTQLTIAGTLNGEDLSCMRMMMGRDNDNAVTPGKLSDIDLTDVHLAAGGMVGPYHHEAAENQIVQGTFAGCEKLTHVVLPADATTIEKDAFADCTSLREIEIPASAGSILPSSGCTALEALTVSPANANYKSQDRRVAECRRQQNHLVSDGQEGQIHPSFRLYLHWRLRLQGMQHRGVLSVRQRQNIRSRRLHGQSDKGNTSWSRHQADSYRRFPRLPETHESVSGSQHRTNQQLRLRRKSAYRPLCFSFHDSLLRRKRLRQQGRRLLRHLRAPRACRHEKEISEP